MLKTNVLNIITFFSALFWLFLFTLKKTYCGNNEKRVLYNIIYRYNLIPKRNGSRNHTSISMRKRLLIKKKKMKKTHHCKINTFLISLGI